MQFEKKTLWDFFIDHARFTYVVVIALTLFGFFAIVQLPKESDPEVDIPIAVVVTPFPGASPLDVEELVTTPIEDKLARISGIDDMTSVSSNGLSSITVEFNIDTDRDTVIGDVKDAVDEVQVDLPGDAEDSVVSEVSTSDQPFLQISLGGPYSIPELTAYAKQIERIAEGVTGVSNIQVIGGRDEEIIVFVDKPSLDRFGISITDVTRAIQSANSDIPIGAIETGGEVFNLRFAGRLTDASDVARVPVGRRDGIPVFVSDIARVEAGYVQERTLSRMNPDNTVANSAVTLLAYKVRGGDIVDISSAVRAEIDRAIDTELPNNLTSIVLFDLAEYIQEDISSLSKNGFATVMLVFIILLFFLGLREAVIASLSIPLAFLMTFIYLLMSGLTINFMTLFSLILSLGILVDSAIVINEGIHAKREQGISSSDAAKLVVREYQWPLIAGTLTTVFAFVPMLLTSGIIGEYIKGIPITVSGVLVSSLFIALGVVTTISAGLLKKNVRREYTNGIMKTVIAVQKYITTRTDQLTAWYQVRIRALLESKKQRKYLRRWIIVAFVFSIAMPATGILKVNMFPTSNEPRFTIELEMPIGTPLAGTANVLEKIEHVLMEDSYVTSYVVNAGQSFSAGSTGGGLAENHVGYIDVILQEKNRPTSDEFVTRYETILKEQIRDGNIRVSQGTFGPPSEAPVLLTIRGNDLDILDTLARDVEALLQNTPGTQNITSSVVETNGEFVISVNRRLAERYGVSAGQVAGILRTAVNGSVATSINTIGEDVDIRVRYALNSNAGSLTEEKVYQTSLETINALTIATPEGNVPLASLATIDLEASRNTIRHKDGDRIAQVTSFAQTGSSAIEILGLVQAKIDTMDFPSGYTITIGGENEDINKSFADMFRAMILAVFLIASLLVLQFNSFRQSLIILFTIPLALIGVFPGLALLGLPLSFPGIIGIVALVGIVVNNAIILIDRINKEREDGTHIHDALVSAGKARLRPILLTTVTTVFGILPLAITQEVWRSLGFAIIFGLIGSTILTLVVVPVLYLRLYRKEDSSM